MPRFRTLAGALLLTASISVGGCGERPPAEDCRRICWKAAEFAYHKKIEDKLAVAFSEDEKREIIEKGKEGWQAMKDLSPNPDLLGCETSCQKDGRPKQVECIDAATTHAQIVECMR